MKDLKKRKRASVRFKMMMYVMFFLLTVSLWAQAPEVTWNVTYDSGYDDQALSIVTDGDDNIYVAGYSHNGTNYDFRTIKYDSSGTILWNVIYDSGKNDWVVKVAVDSAGNVFVSGTSHDGSTGDMLNLKYDSSGALLWAVTYDSGIHDMVSGTVPDAAGNLYAAGVRYTGGWSSDRYMIKYDSSGTVLWSKYDVKPGRDRSGGITLDSAGNIYITGFIDDRFRTTKYDANVNVIWDHVYNPGVYDYSYGITVDDAGNVYVLGYSGDNYTYHEVVILKYNSTGNLQWDRRYNAGGFASNGGIIADAAGNIYVSAYSVLNWPVRDPLDFHLLKYDTDGTLLWDIPFDSGSKDRAAGVTLDSSGNIILTGFSLNGSHYDFRTIKYGDAGSLSIGAFAVFATNSIHLKSGAVIHSGHIGVADESPGPWLASDSEVTVGEDVYADDDTAVYGDTVTLEPRASVFDIYYNQLNNEGTVRGIAETPLTLPLPVTLPSFPTPAPGSEDITVAKKETLSLAPGAYGHVHVRGSGTLLLTGGTYHFESLSLDSKDAALLFQAASDVIINQHLDTGNESMLAPHDTAPITAADIRLYVNGTNAGGDDPLDGKKAAVTGTKNTIKATIFVPNGTAWIKTKSVFEGCIIGRDVIVGHDVEITLNSSYN